MNSNVGSLKKAIKVIQKLALHLNVKYNIVDLFSNSLFRNL